MRECVVCWRPQRGGSGLMILLNFSHKKMKKSSILGSNKTKVIEYFKGIK